MYGRDRFGRRAQRAEKSGQRLGRGDRLVWTITEEIDIQPCGKRWADRWAQRSANAVLPTPPMPVRTTTGATSGSASRPAATASSSTRISWCRPVKPRDVAGSYRDFVVRCPATWRWTPLAMLAAWTTVPVTSPAGVFSDISAPMSSCAVLPPITTARSARRGTPPNGLRRLRCSDHFLLGSVTGPR